MALSMILSDSFIVIHLHVLLAFWNATSCTLEQQDFSEQSVITAIAVPLVTVTEDEVT